MPSVNKSISTLHGVAPELPPYGMSHISRQEYRARYHSRANVHEQGVGNREAASWVMGGPTQILVGPRSQLALNTA